MNPANTKHSNTPQVHMEYLLTIINFYYLSKFFYSYLFIYFCYLPYYYLFILTFPIFPFFIFIKLTSAWTILNNHHHHQIIIIIVVILKGIIFLKLNCLVGFVASISNFHSPYAWIMKGSVKFYEYLKMRDFIFNLLILLHVIFFVQDSIQHYSYSSYYYCLNWDLNDPNLNSINFVIHFIDPIVEHSTIDLNLYEYDVLLSYMPI